MQEKGALQGMPGLRDWAVWTGIGVRKAGAREWAAGARQAWRARCLPMHRGCRRTWRALSGLRLAECHTHLRGPS